MLKSILTTIVTAIFSIMLGLLIGANSIMGKFEEKLDDVHEDVKFTKTKIAVIVNDQEHIEQISKRHEKRIDKLEDRWTMLIKE